MDTKELAAALSVLGRLRRAQPRNPDTIEVCDGYERLLLAKPGQVVTVTAPPETLQPAMTATSRASEALHSCPICEARRQAADARLKKHRAAKKKATKA